MNLKKQVWDNRSSKNYSYYPIIFKDENFLLKIIQILNYNNVYGRRYFYPSLSKGLPYLKQKEMNITDDISKRIYCLPLYYGLKEEEVDFICTLILNEFNE